MIHVWVPRKLTALDKFKASVAPRRPKRLAPGSHLSDLTSLRKIVLLCPKCVRGFDWRKPRYIKEEMLCVSKCDVCGSASRETQGFVPEENWHIAHGGQAPPRRGRWGLPRSTEKSESRAIVQQVPNIAPKAWATNLAYVLDLARR